MRIGDSVQSYTNGVNEVNREDKKPSILEKISAMRSLSGTDSANLTIAEELLNRELTSRAEISNSQNAIALMQIADSTLTSLSDSSAQIRELSVRANSGVLNSDQQAMIESEVNALKESMGQAIEGATFNGKAIFGNEFEFQVGELFTMSFDTIDVNSIDITDYTSLDNFDDVINQMRSDVGANVNELEESITQKLNSIVEDVSARANIEDNDLVQNLVELSKEKLQEEAMLFVQSQNRDYLQKQAMVLLT